MITCPTIVIFIAMYLPFIACSSQSCVKDIIHDFEQMKVDVARSKAAVKTAFFAALSPHFTLTGINAILKFDDVKLNRGEAYDPSTGVFTARVPGLYHFSCMILANHGAVVHYQLNKNDQPYILGYSHKGLSADSSTISAVMELAAGDRVFIKHRHTGASEVVFGAAHTSFSGYFIAP
ncbi:collagen alpha-1(VIII) chain-like isoform X1 [Mytilus trossulus]|uniref:collagen alpha-1(VIII) chain-like isoform X1 n=1 Tax=Mytilus trossulus TaxID=6551 RepID=UPI003006FE11